MLTLPHQTSSRTSGSSTTRLSVGLRPVFFPEYAIIAPVEEIAVPFSNFRAASYRNAGVALRWISATEIPCLSRLKGWWADMPGFLTHSGICGPGRLCRTEVPVGVRVVGVGAVGLPAQRTVRGIGIGGRGVERRALDQRDGTREIRQYRRGDRAL